MESRSASGEAKVTVRTVLPTEYARADMASPAVWIEMRSAALPGPELFPELCSYGSASLRKYIDALPVVRARSWIYGQQKAMIVDPAANSTESSCYAERGDTLPTVKTMTSVIPKKAKPRNDLSIEEKERGTESEIARNRNSME